MSISRRLAGRFLLGTLGITLLGGVAPIEPLSAGRAATFKVAAFGVDPPSVTCRSCLVIDDLGRTLFARTPSAPRPNASTTKMVTALVVRRSGTPLDEVVAVSGRAASTGAAGLDLEAGDRFSVRELLYALLLTSSNDSAVALAEHVSGTEARFVAEMNDLASGLGARDSRFLTSHGLHEPGHVSTARDLALFATEVLQDGFLRQVVATSEHAVTGSDRRIPLENRNLLLDSYRGAVGVKTGFTNEAGNVLVAAARRGGRAVISVAMDSVDMFADSRRLLDFGFARLARTRLLRAGEVVGTVVFDSGSVVAVARDGVRGLADPARIQVEFELGAGVTGELRPGQDLGAVAVMSGNRTLGLVDAVAEGGLEPQEPSWLTRCFAGLLSGGARLLGGGG